MAKKQKMIKLTAELPMTSAMFTMLVNNYVNTTEKCCSCLHCNGECGDFAKAGTCKAMDERINKVLVFHTGELEFATTREKISKMLAAQHQSDYDGYIPETVNEVIEDYINGWVNTSETDPFADFGKENGFAASLYENLKDEVFGAIIYELDWSNIF